MNHATIPAIETRYNGFYFRSRAEARYAIFFDVLNVPYQYEPEKFDLPSGRYIPDFRLVGFDEYTDTFIEVKGAEPTEAELLKASELSSGRIGSCFVAYGNVNDKLLAPQHRKFETNYYCCETVPGFSVRFGQCILCGRLTVSCGVHDAYHRDCRDEIDKIASRYDIDSCFTDFTPAINPYAVCTTFNGPLISLATEAARSARFESPEFEPMLSAYLRTAEILKEAGAFGRQDEYDRLHRMALDLHNDPACPRYERRRRKA